MTRNRNTSDRRRTDPKPARSSGASTDPDAARRDRGSGPRSERASDHSKERKGPGRATSWDRWLLAAAGLSVLLLLTAGAFRRIWEADFWWQLRTGRLIAESGIPRIDVFSFPSQGRPWIEARWLFDLLLYETVRVAGYGGAVVAKWIAVLAAFGFVAGAAFTAALGQGWGSRIAGALGPGAPRSPQGSDERDATQVRTTATAMCAVTIVAILASSQRFFVRPELATYVLLAAFVWIVARVRAGTSSRLLWILPVLQLLWVNMHTLFIMGPGVVGLLLAVEVAERLESRRGGAAGRPLVRAGRTSSAERGPDRLAAVDPVPEDRARTAAPRSIDAADPGGLTTTAALVLAATIGACLLNPYGLRGALVPFQLFSELHDPVFKGMIGELKTPFSFAQSYTAVAAFEALIGLCLVSAVLNLRRLDPFWTLLCALQLYLAATSIRNLPLFALAAIPFVVVNVARSALLARVPSRWRTRATRLLAAGCAAAALVVTRDLATDRFNVRQNDTNQFGAGLATHRFPESTARFLREKVPSANVLNTMFEGAYLLAHDTKVFIDPRLEVHGPRLLERYTLMQTDRGAWESAVREFDLRAAIVDLQSQFIGQMRGAGDWSLVDFDEVAAVFVRAGLAGAPPAIATAQDWSAAVGRLRARLPAPRPIEQVSWLGRVESPAPYLRAASFLMSMGQADAAEPFVRDALAAARNPQGAHMIEAQIREARRDLAGAAGEYRAELDTDPANLLAQRNLAACVFKLGRFDQARGVLERYVASVPTDPMAWGMLTRAYAELGRAADALRSAEATAKLAPKNADFQRNLGLLQAVSGHLPEAILALTRAAKIAPSDAGTRIELARVLARAGRTKEALGALDAALALRPGDPDALRLKQSLLAGGGAQGG